MVHEVNVKKQYLNSLAFGKSKTRVGMNSNSYDVPSLQFLRQFHGDNHDRSTIGRPN